MIETAQGNRIVLNGGITLSRLAYEYQCEKPDDRLAFVHREPLLKMTEIENRWVISGLRLFKDNTRIEITGQA